MFNCVLLENQYKSPTSTHTRRQSSFRSSINPSKSFGGVVAGSNRSNKKQKK